MKKMDKAKLCGLIGCFLLGGCSGLMPTKSSSFKPTENYISFDLQKEFQKQEDFQFIVQSAVEQIKLNYQPLKTRFNMVKTLPHDFFGLGLRDGLMKEGFAFFEVENFNNLNAKKTGSLLDEMEHFNLFYSLDKVDDVFYLVLKVQNVGMNRVMVYNCPFVLNAGKWERAGFWTTYRLGEFEVEKPDLIDKVKDNVFAVSEGLL